MALTDREKQLLAEMEAALATEDPTLQSTLAGESASLSAKRGLRSFGLGKAALLFIAGIAVLFAGLVSKTTAIGVSGFILALTGLLFAIRALSTQVSAAGKAARRPRSSFSDRLNQRWDKRQGE